MSLLAEIKSIAEGLNIKVETGVFSGKAPDEYIVLTPLSDGFDMHCDNMPTRLGVFPVQYRWHNFLL